MINIERYEQARANDEGFCTNCDNFTTDGVEPDAEGYKCPACGEFTVIGAEELVFLELVE